jgi:hypothetical protein
MAHTVTLQNRSFTKKASAEHMFAASFQSSPWEHFITVICTQSYMA